MKMLTRHLSLILLLAMMLLIPFASHAQNCVGDEEPNNEPDNAQPFAECAEGILEQDDQDLFVFSVTGGETLRQFTLEGSPGVLTRAELFVFSDGRPQSLLDFKTPNGGTTQTPTLLLLPGDYLLGVSNAGGVGAYRLSATETGSLPAATETEPNDDRDNAMPLTGEFAIAGNLQGSVDWFAWTMPAANANDWWQIELQAGLGQSPEIDLYNSDNQWIARARTDKSGRAIFYDLQLPASEYRLQIRGATDLSNPYQFSATNQGVPPSNNEIEPNDETQQEIFWDTNHPITGRIAGINDEDFYQFAISEAESSQRFELQLTSASSQRRRVCLFFSAANQAQCRDGLGELVLPDLILPAGDYLLQVAGEADPSEPYQLRKVAVGVAEPGAEAEPNDTYLSATPLSDKQRAAGRFVGNEWDIFQLTIPDTPQLWRIQAIGAGLTQLAYINTAGQFTQSITGQRQRRLRMDNLFLLPGAHFIGVRGEGGDYNVMAIPLGPPPPGVEREPNSAEGQANPLLFDQRRIGLLNEDSDIDFYRFTLPAEEVVKLTVISPDDGNVRIRLMDRNGYVIGQNVAGVPAGVPYTLVTRLQPSDYLLRLDTDQVGDSAYTALLERLDPFTQLTDIEPNDQIELAGELPASRILGGNVIQNNDIDWYALPAVSRATPIQIEATEGIRVDLYAVDVGNISNEFEHDDTTNQLTGMLVPQTDYRIRVQGDGGYEIVVTMEDGVQPPPLPGQLPAQAGIRLENDEAAAFWRHGQRIAGMLTAQNQSNAAINVQLTWHSSHYKIWLEGFESVATLPANGKLDIPVAIAIAADLPTGDYPITIQIADAEGAQTTAQTMLSAQAETAALGQERVWRMPAQMLGGFNAAALAFGAEIVTEDADLAERQLALHDGYTALQDGLNAPFADEPLELIIDLAGDVSLPIAGIALNPQGKGNESDKLNAFELLLSTDGREFFPALSGVLRQTPIEQYYPLDQPTPARFAMLRLISSYAVNRGRIDFGEWKVIAQPGTELLPEINLADPQNGGYLAYAYPQPNTSNDAVSILLADSRTQTIRLDDGASAAWVLGFHHDRAGQISRLEWVEGVASGERLTNVAVSVSLDSPVGPWQPVGDWALGSGTSTFELAQPIWARFVRLEATGNNGGDRFRPSSPDAIRIFERPLADEYRSLIGEWGHYNRDGAYEWLTPLPASQELRQDDNDSREKADEATPGVQIADQAQIGEDVDWYRIDVPAEQNAVVLQLNGNPTLDVSVVFEDEAGQRLPATSRVVNASQQIFTATVPSDSTVYFRIEEPPRSVIFSWDTSGSVGAYFDTIYNALSNFVAGVTPGRELVNFLPFGNQLLLEDWGEEPARLQQALTNYERSDGSSNAETALLRSSEELVFREGVKAVILITDAETGSYNETENLWRALEAAQPRVFSLAISSHVSVGEMPANEQDLMQSWASVNNGHYDFLRTSGEMDLAFARATAWLRRPAGYTFVAHTALVQPPGPGTLTLLSSSSGEDVAASASLLGDTAVEFVLDASGSMQQPLGDSSRIEVAREVLLDLVENVLPDDVPVALRVFGNREGNFSCRTDLEMALQPLNRAEMSGVIAGIQPQTDANTAIADSLALTPDDLADAPGAKLIILLTDGEETCDGDPEAVIADLRQQGLDVRVNIVGFAIDNQALKATFASWAKAGGGDYFDAANSEQLSDSLSHALRTPYRVLNEDGEVVAEGLVDGEGVALPAGVYAVRVFSDPIIVVKEVIIGGDDEVVLRIEGN